jgi:HEAT repeat protein
VQLLEHDPDLLIRYHAARALSIIGGTEAQTALRKAVAADSCPYVVSYALKGI